jgi:hypothetical protein
MDDPSHHFLVPHVGAFSLVAHGIQLGLRESVDVALFGVLLGTSEPWLTTVGC